MLELLLVGVGLFGGALVWDALSDGADIEQRTGSDEDDVIMGNGDMDELFGKSGDDELFGGDADDRLFGEDGDDLLSGGLGDDFIRGGAGADILVGDEGEDHLIGGLGDDVLSGVSFLDAQTIGNVTSLGIDTDDADILLGGYDDDEIAIGSGDIAVGGHGNDMFILGSWLADDGADQGVVQDYNSEQDVLVVTYDGTVTPSPSIDVREASNDNGEPSFEIYLNDVAIGVVAGSSNLNVEDISLIDISAAA